MRVGILTIFLMVLSVAAQDRPLKILEKPTPVLSKEQREMMVEAQGMVMLKVEFLSTGEVGQIWPILRLPYSLTDNAVDAARQIKFVPAMVSGQPVTKRTTVRYS